MNTRKMHEKVHALIAPVVESLGLELWGIEFAAAGHRSVLRIFVDHPRDLAAETEAAARALADAEAPPVEKDTDYVWEQEEAGADEAPGAETSQDGVTIAQCAEISKHVGLILEVDDVVPGAYTLEVSSPGFERPFFSLDQFGPYIGREITLELKDAMGEPFPGRKKLTGTLTARPENALPLVVDGEELAVAWGSVKKARLVHHFETKGQKKAGQKKAGHKKKKGKSRK